MCCMHYSSFCSRQQERRQLSVKLAFQSPTLQLPPGGTMRNDTVHGTSDTRFRFLAGEQLFTKVAVVPETAPYPTLSREGWRRISLQKGRGFFFIYVILKAGNRDSPLNSFATFLLLHLFL